MKHNKSSLKKASMICNSQKPNNRNLFVIYNCYDKLATLFDANPDLNPDNIWNCDESRFPTDPGKSKVHVINLISSCPMVHAGKV